MKVLTICRTSAIRMFRDRVNIFTVFLFPLVTVLLVGSRFGGGDIAEIGVLGNGALTKGVVQNIEDSGKAEVRRFDSESEMRAEIADEELDLGLVLPAEVTGRKLDVQTVIGPGERGRQLQGVVSTAIADAAFLPTVAAELGEDAAERVEAAAERLPTTEVETSRAGDSVVPEGAGAFDFAAAQQLILLIFLKPLLGASSVFQSRELGVSRRMLSTPTRPSTIVLGEGLGQWLLAVVQGLYILLACAVVFDVDWGNLPAALLLILALAAAGTGLGMLIAAISPSENAASGYGILAGLGLGLLGGVLVPLDFFNDTMADISQLTPHAWVAEAFSDLHAGAGVADVLPQIGIVCGFSVVLLALAAWRFRITLTRA